MDEFQVLSKLLAPVLQLLGSLTAQIMASTRLSQTEKRALLRTVAARLNDTAAKVAAKEI